MSDNTLEKNRNKQNVYYKAYDQRYKQTYEQNVLWETQQPTKEVMETIKKYNINNKNKILDLGCGEGRDSIELLKKGYNILAVDYSQTVIDKCNELTNNKYFNNFKQLDIIEDKLNNQYDFIYSIAVLHMFVSDEHRTKYYQFIREHLTNNGYALIITMGDGIKEYSTNHLESFNIVKRKNINNNKDLYVAKTSCKIVNWLTLEKEIKNNNLKIINKYISKNLPNFDKCMCVVIKK